MPCLLHDLNLCDGMFLLSLSITHAHAVDSHTGIAVGSNKI